MHIPNEAIIGAVCGTVGATLQSLFSAAARKRSQRRTLNFIDGVLLPETDDPRWEAEEGTLSDVCLVLGHVEVKGGHTSGWTVRINGVSLRPSYAVALYSDAVV